MSAARATSEAARRDLPIRVSSLVLCQSVAVAQAMTAALRLQRAQVIELTDLAGVPWWGSAPELAVVIEWDANAAASALRMLKRRRPSIKILVVGLPNREEALLRGFAAGADGVVVGAESLDHVVQAARDVLAGGIRRLPQVFRPLVNRLVWLQSRGRHATRGPLVTRLSTREGEIFARLATGQNNKDIALGLHLEVQTVKNHVTRILRKLHLPARLKRLLQRRRTGFCGCSPASRESCCFWPPGLNRGMRRCVAHGREWTRILPSPASSAASFSFFSFGRSDCSSPHGLLVACGSFPRKKDRCSRASYLARRSGSQL